MREEEVGLLRGRRREGSMANEGEEERKEKSAGLCLGVAWWFSRSEEKKTKKGGKEGSRSGRVGGNPKVGGVVPSPKREEMAKASSKEGATT